MKTYLFVWPNNTVSVLTAKNDDEAVRLIDIVGDPFGATRVCEMGQNTIIDVDPATEELATDASDKAEQVEWFTFDFKGNDIIRKSVLVAA